MPQPGLAPNAARNAVESSLAAKARPGPERAGGAPLTVSERILMVSVMIGAWIVMSLLSVVQR